MTRKKIHSTGLHFEPNKTSAFFSIIKTEKEAKTDLTSTGSLPRWKSHHHWARTKLQSRGSYIAHVSAKSPNTEPILAAFPLGAMWEVNPWTEDFCHSFSVSLTLQLKTI